MNERRVDGFAAGKVIKGRGKDERTIMDAIVAWPACDVKQSADMIIVFK
jgi:hypothetical protein